MTPQERVLARDLMTVELLKSALMHDLRGAATALLGWHSLLPESEARAYGGLARSISGLEDIISLFGTPTPPDVVESNLRDVAASAGVVYEGKPTRAVVSSQRFEAALWASGAEGILVRPDVRGRIRVDILGLDEDSICLLLSPQASELIVAAREGGRRIGTCLFKEVVRGVRGEYVSDGPGGLCLLLDGLDSA